MSRIPVDPSVLVVAGAGKLPEAARLLAAAGLPVFPCVPGGKRPLTPHGFHDATTDTNRIDAWWRRWPEANIGLRTGCGIDVLDVDRHRTESGFPAMVRLQQAHLLQGWIAVVRSPSGGLHLYYPSPASEQRSWSRPGAQIDFRGGGGYVIVAPSRIAQPDGTNARYRLITTRPVGQPLDAEAIRTLLTPAHPFGATRIVPGRQNIAQKVDQLAGWVGNLTEGSRNTGLFWASCRAAQLGTDAEAVLVEAAVRAGLGPREAFATIRSAYRAVALSDGTSPPPATDSRRSPTRAGPSR